MSGDSNNNQNVKIDITSDASGMGPGVALADQQLQSLERSTSKLASQYTGMNDAVKETDKSLRGLIDRYDPLGAKMHQLQEDFRRLNTAAANGQISLMDEARVDQAYTRMTQQMNLYSSATKGAALSAGQLRMANKQLPMQFTDIWVSLAAGQSPMMVMLQQGTQIKDSFGGIGNAAKAMGGYIMGLVNPLTLAAAAAAAGAYVWYNWGESAREAAYKARAAAKSAEKDATAAWGGVQKTPAEQIAEVQGKMAGAQGQLDAAIAQRNAITRSTSAEVSQAIGAEVLARRREVEGYRRQVEQLRSIKPKADAEETAEIKHQKEIDSTIAREQSKYERLHEMALQADATDAERVTWKLAFDLQEMERGHEQAVAVYGKNEMLEQAYQDARVDRVAMAQAQIDRLQKDAATKDEKAAQQKMRTELGVANFSKLIRQGDYVNAMTMAERMTAGLATKSRAAFEVNKAASLAKATVQGYQMIQAAAADGANWGGYWGAIAEGALAAVFVATQLDGINSTQFGGGSAPSRSGAGGGGVPSQATSPGLPVTPTEPVQQQQQQPVQINIYNTGNVMSADFVDSVVIPQIKDQVANSDVVIIDPRSRQAQILGA